MNSPVPTLPAAEPSWRTKLAYGVGGVPNFFGNIALRNLAVPFYHMTLHLDPALLGLALAVPRIWDALLDPVIGHLSDRTRSRFGRRRPYILFGAITGALTFALIWWVPLHWNEQAQLGWLLVASLLFYTCHNFWSIPFLSLGYELSTDYHGRTRIMAAHGYFLKLAELGSQWIFPLTQLAIFSSTLGGMRLVTLGVGILVFGVLGIIPGIFVRERFAATKSAPRLRGGAGFLRAVGEVLRNRAFCFLLALTLLKVVVGMFANSLDYYLLVYSVCGGNLAEGSVWKAALTSGAALVGLAAIRPIVRLSERLDKRRALIGVYLLLAVGGVAKWWIFQPGHTWLLLLDPLLCGPVWVATALLLPSMLADVCDQDELHSGERREGLYSSVLLWFQQMAAAAALYFSGSALNHIGFDVARAVSQEPRVMLILRLLVSGVTVAVALLSIALLRHYPLSRQTLREIGETLASRRPTP